MRFDRCVFDQVGFLFQKDVKTLQLSQISVFIRTYVLPNITFQSHLTPVRAH